MKTLIILLSILISSSVYAGCSDPEVQKAIKLTERGVNSSDACLASGECDEFNAWMNADHSIIKATNTCLVSPKSKLEKKYKSRVLALMLNLGKIKEILQFVEENK